MEEAALTSQSIVKPKNKRSDIEMQVMQIQSENKQQYKKLADALEKSKQYSRV